ncbi:MULTISPECIES: hypothetical protein [unclassified Niallia]|uniref:hypothetical protein n=1 Tax=unclassified Niallia TaxID=2837522 RepID=UPI001EDC7BA6|nr:MULTISPECIES: hypothetical protein [unclassified Niallia]MCM3030926.1 hypothetical protein [Niallia sp. MER 6]UPO90532.1 hypothetical protein L8T27_020990 [Niallia sp. Man26]
MKLYYKEEYLGDIHDANREGAWVYGTFKPAANIEKIKTILETFTKEDHEFAVDQFNAEWLDESNWFIADEQGDKKEIEIPAVYPDGEINWRWR